MLADMSDLDFLLTHRWDDYGEILHGSLVDEIKEINIQVMKELKVDDLPPPKLQDIWKIQSQHLVTDRETDEQHFNNF